MTQKLKLLIEKLKDERSKKVIFVAHCILNENVRFLGTAYRRSSIDETIKQLQENEFGIIQMPCPEQIIYGGSLKRQSLQMVGTKDKLAYRLGKLLMPVFNWNIKRICQKIAKGVVKDIKTWKDSDFEVIGIIGFDGCPFCGVNAIMDSEKSFDFIAKTKLEELNREKLNEIFFKEIQINGEGFFIQALKKELQNKNSKVDFYALDFLSEYEKKDMKINFNQ